MTLDFRLTDAGSIVLLTPLSGAGHDWVKEHLPLDTMMFGGAFVIERRYAFDIVQGIANDGLELQ